MGSEADDKKNPEEGLTPGQRRITLLQMETHDEQGGEHFDSNQAELGELSNNVAKEMEALGLYMVGGGFQSPDMDQDGSIKTQLDEGRTLVFTCGFRVGDLAWSERILEPDTFASKKEFSLIAPPEEEISLAAILEELEGIGKNEDEGGISS